MDEIPSGAPGADDYRDMLKRLRVLVVGGGAIGQVFGTHLQTAGAEVSYFLKPKYAADAKEGWDLHKYGLAGVRPRKHLKPAEVFTDHRYLRTKTFDQVWLCVSSPALRTGLLEQLNGSCPNAVWVTFQPGLEDRNYLIQRVPENKLVTGLVNFIAYQAPLPGEDLWPEGIAYFVPPFSMTQFTGPEPYASAVANLLQTGGLTAGVRPDTAVTARYGSSVLIPFVTALECSAWSFSQLRGNDALLKLMAQAITDIQTAVEKAHGAFPGSFAMAQKTFAWKLGLFAAPTLASFPLEEYFKYHFTKVREQSDQMVDDFAQLCRDNAIVPRALESLAEQWRTRRRPAPKAANTQPTPQPGGLEENTPLPGQVPPAGAPVSVTGANVAVTNTGANAAVTNTGANPAMPNTGANPAIANAAADAASQRADSAHSLPAKPDDSVVEPTRPMAIDGARPLTRNPAPEPQRAQAAPIEVDFDFGGDDQGPRLEVGGPGEMLAPEGLEEPTDHGAASAAHGDDDDDEIFVSDGAASHRRELPELDLELELEPLPAELESKPSAPAPVLRTLADLDHIPAVQDAPEQKPKRNKPLPFDVESEADEESLPSIVVDPDLETDEQPRSAMQTIRNPAPGPVHFRDAVPEDEQKDLRRQDFIQTEFANEEQNADLRNLKNKLRARLSEKKSMSPALDDED